jgi:hypothetical protein
LTEYCGAAGCTQPLATAALTSGASVADFEFDTLGSVYLTGSFDQPIDFGSGVVDPGGASNIFIAKDSTTASLEWLETFGIQTFGASSPPSSTGMALGLDRQSGDVFVTGRLHGAVDFGGGPIGDVATDAAEVVALPGNVCRELHRDRQLPLGQALWYLFVTALDKATGAPRWSKGLPYEGEGSDSGFAQITGLAIDSAERLFVSGWWRGTWTLMPAACTAEEGSPLISAAASAKLPVATISSSSFRTMPTGTTASTTSSEVSMAVQSSGRRV